MQQNGLDEQGQVAEEAVRLTLEVVQGLREVIYWEKIPEKVRKSALMKASCDQSTKEDVMRDTLEGGEENAGKKKRRRI